MRTRIVSVVLLVALAIAVGVAASHNRNALDGRLAESNAPKATSTPAPVNIHVGTPDSAGWSATT
ncbi:MAG: hypothetical protein E6K77_01920, partial [Candidatus Eisenbacteria bacterium]